MQHNLLVFSVYAFSGDYLISLKKKLGRDFDQMTLMELRQCDSGLHFLQKLRRIRPYMLLIPLQDERSITLLSLLKLLAGLTRAKYIALVQPNFDLKPVNRLSLIPEIFRFGFASFACLTSTVWSWIELKYLLSKRRITVSRVRQSVNMLYLKTNLWFGLQAGGSIGHIAGVVNAFHRYGFSVTVASTEAPMMVDSTVVSRKVSLPRTFGVPYELNNYRVQWFLREEVSRILTKKDFSWIYQRLSIGNYLGVLLSRAFKLPLVVEYNGSEVWVAKHWGSKPLRFHALANYAEEVMLRHAHLVVTISEVLRDELIERGIEAARIVCYPNCIDPSIFSPERFSEYERQSLRARYGIPSDATVVTFIGTFGLWHGAEVLASTIARLYTEQTVWLAQHKVHFLLVGDGLRMPQVRAIIEAAGARAICTLVGLVPQEQAALHLATADILVSPHVPNPDGTRFFGSPTKLFEYMAMQKGIFASELDQIGEVLSPGIDVRALPVEAPQDENRDLAVLGEPGNCEHLLLGIKFLVERADWRAHLAKNARLRALERYTWDHHVKAIIEGLKRISADKD